MDHLNELSEAIKSMPLAFIGQVARSADRLPKWLHALLGPMLLAFLPALGSLGLYWLGVRDDIRDMKSTQVVIVQTVKDIQSKQNTNSDRILKLETEHDVEHGRNGNGK